MTNTQSMPYGRTYRERFQAIKGGTSMPSSKRSAPCATMQYQYLDLATPKEQISWFGTKPETSWEVITPSRGERLTLNTGECPNVARESTLSQILQVNVPEKYYLSPTACEGICRRAMKRGKVLPLMLWEALMEVLEMGGN